MTRMFFRRFTFQWPPGGRRTTSILAAAALLTGTLAATTPSASASPKPAAPGPAVDVYQGDLTSDQIRLLNNAGVDRDDVTLTKGAKAGTTHVVAVLSGDQAARLGRAGVRLEVRKVDGKNVAARAKAAPEKVFRPYSGAGNIREEIVELAAEHPDIAQAVDIGKAVSGQPITAIRVSKDVRHLKDGRRPAVVYQAAQHAREWITPEMIRRLLHHDVENYGTDAAVTKLVDTTDLWFIPVVNVDGYDLTFQPDFRLWRKNVRDNNGDGQITGADGVDLNRNFPYKWGYDNEGSTDQPSGETYRGPSPESEPETKAQDALYKRLRPKYVLNYHSAAELLLHGVGWQTLTRSPDDALYDALLGDIDHPAVPGYTPELGAQLYTTNGDTDGQLDHYYGSLSITPEMATCTTASREDPDDQWDPADCGSDFEFPDDEALIAREFQKNLPLAMAVGQSATHPDRPTSPVGRTAPDFEPDPFTTSYGSSQEVASVIRRAVPAKRVNYRVNGGRTRTAGVSEWRGGERYGRDNRIYYGEYRARISGQRPGDKVEVWFSGGSGGKAVQSAHWTYTVRDQKRADVLVVADEDYKGVNPTYPAGTAAPRYGAQYAGLVNASGHRALVWDIDKDGVPHDLGVLKHFKAVVWELGDNRLTQDAADEPLHTVIGDYPDSQVADRAKDLVLQVRSYLNEGGKLLNTGETTGYNGPLAQANGGGIYYGLKGHPEKPCVITTSFRDDCELLSDDFLQYYLGAYDRQIVGNPTGFAGAGKPFGSTTADLAGTATNPVNEAGGFQVTSTVLPPSQYPQFRSWKSGDYLGRTGPYEPAEGSWYVAGTHQDSLYRRLTRTVDLSSVTAAQAPALQAQLSYSTETGYDHVIVEAHTAGADDWTTLPDKNGRTTTRVPADCEQGFLTDMHPFLLHYLTQANPCGNTGSTGAWNSFTGNSNGWVPAAFDLSAYAGKKVEVSISYVSDPFTGGAGLFIDDTKVTTTGGTLDAEGFETGLGPWAIQGAPAGSPGNTSEFVRSQAVIDTVAAVSTKDSVLLGFGIEQAKTTAQQRDLVARSLRYLIG
ncbi:M14 family metallopeptidase [Actinomadura parmotrematis]|uniref:Immune inhibitor A n=1 Tax=Actinomadura parmotrematis TaxID=2864039 RepID=A0ABS7FZY3_9ACTN|nr:M14 family metallopeptidase [Actinomadura parmotrematis]MBW8485816.1 immune inhibitor A [Actinomadura parmotrematis]